MGYQPRIKTPRAATRGYRKPEREKSKSREQRRGYVGRSKKEEKVVATAEEVTDATFKRLHILGNQRFGFSLFSEHFERWLFTLQSVLREFESSPNITVDEQFVNERSQIFSTVQAELENKRQKEIALNMELRSVVDSKTLLERVKDEYVAKARGIRKQKNREIKRLYGVIDNLQKDLDEAVRMKTGFFRGISKKDREQKEMAAAQALSNAQRMLELAMLDFTEAKKGLREEFENKREPLTHQIKDDQKKAESTEVDGSLEDRWFACEALADAVNALLQRKALQLH
jgi:hypothetical protein